MSIRRSTGAFLGFAALGGLTSVALAAFASHGLKNVAPTGDQAVIWFTQATDFQINHALAIILVALVSEHLAEGLARKLVLLGGVLMCFGILFFCGALYSTSFNGPVFFAPWGGTCSMLGWLSFGIGAVLAAFKGEYQPAMRAHAQPAE